jgi:hypothetical protein
MARTFVDAMDPGPQTDIAGDWPEDDPNECNPQNAKRKEWWAMTERDLGAQELKTVRYRIIFTKRNNEATLKEEQDTINYSTDPMGLSGRKLSDFWAAAVLGEEQEARRRLAAAGYADFRDPAPPHNPIPPAPPPRPWTIKEEDKKYVTFRYEVLDRLPKQEAEYAREQVDVLKEIRDALR